MEKIMEKPTSYYVPAQSVWPIVGAVALACIVIGGANYIQNHSPNPKWANDTGMLLSNLLWVGVAALIFMMFGWWRDVIKENNDNLYSDQMHTSFRHGMCWFITSEVMFFCAFFGALFYARTLIIPWLGGEGNNAMTHDLLWPNFIAQWPLTEFPGVGAVPGAAGEYQRTSAMGPMGLPLWNTIILITSSFTLTWAHHALIKGERDHLNGWLFATVLLGAIFLYLQVAEYAHAYNEMGLTLGSGIYGSTFFMLTGFHGMHVTIGTIFLFVLWVRSMKGHFTADNHFAFEAGAWYWHFVDVVWVLLFIFVYVL
jgi:cytochrome c oxidase subunit III